MLKKRDFIECALAALFLFYMKIFSDTDLTWLQIISILCVFLVYKIRVIIKG